MNNEFDNIRRVIIDHPSNLELKEKGYEPIYSINENSKIIIIGQAPGIKAQESKMTWNDLSGNKLRQWLGVTKEEFYNPNIFAHIPMDFYYPGKSKTGDLPPRKDFAARWHPCLLSKLNNLKLIVLIGSYSQKYYLKTSTLTENVKRYKEYLPLYFPLPHPSPRNISWYLKNPWFESEVIPDLKQIIKEILN